MVFNATFNNISGTCIAVHQEDFTCLTVRKKSLNSDVQRLCTPIINKTALLHVSIIQM